MAMRKKLRGLARKQTLRSYENHPEYGKSVARKLFTNKNTNADNYNHNNQTSPQCLYMSGKEAFDFLDINVKI